MNDFINLLKMRDQLTIIVEKDDDVVDLKSSVIDIDHEKNQFKIYNPIYKNRIHTMILDKVYRFRYIDEKSGIYSFDGRIINRSKERQILILIVKFEGNVEKSQRRSFYRMELVKKVKIKLPMDESVDSAEKLEKSKAEVQFFPREILLRDISGGGFGFLTDDNYAIGDVFLVDINLEGTNIEVIGKVVRKRSTSNDKNKYKYSIGVEFKCLDTKIRREIINFIFNKQRELRKKGLI